MKDGIEVVVPSFVLTAAESIRTVRSGIRFGDDADHKVLDE